MIHLKIIFNTLGIDGEIHKLIPLRYLNNTHHNTASKLKSLCRNTMRQDQEQENINCYIFLLTK